MASLFIYVAQKYIDKKNQVCSPIFVKNDLS